MTRRPRWIHRRKLPPLRESASTNGAPIDAIGDPSRLADDAPIASLQGGVSGRLFNLIRSMACETVGDLRRMSDEELLAIPTFGHRTLEELRSIWRSNEVQPAVTPEKLIY